MSNNKKDVVLFAKREFLNTFDPENILLATLSGKIALSPPFEQTEEDVKEGFLYSDISAEVVIRDCSRQVNLDFDLWHMDDVEKIKAKVDLLRSFVTEFCDTYELAIEEYKSSQRAREEIKKKNEEKPEIGK